ncbi:hypothetical protein [Actinomadura rugatobispora]|uniref:DUF4258 domain-containing protein n=1 Tax=Actinomadura rugatobispora TaxID=1994 RepID=A0ABW1AJU7_9ACTN|nr:hypothetical protein GCM10010200_031130 [Actinomadura rugatobispora]
MKALAAGLTGLLLAGAAAGIAYLLLTDSKQLRYPTQSALRGALASTATDELRRRGISLGKSLTCKDMPGWTKLKLRAGCYGTTSDKRIVHVIGTGEDKSKAHHYTILVDGSPVVENAGCLGPDCHAKTN